MSHLAGEYIETYNPNSFAVDLDNYYLTDAISYVSREQLYWQIGTKWFGTGATTGGGRWHPVSTCCGWRRATPLI